MNIDAKLKLAADALVVVEKHLEFSGMIHKSKHVREAYFTAGTVRYRINKQTKEK